jgi:flagellar basal-body rod protein FlgG
MIKGIYTAATGMVAQQQNIDVIANNIANVNTTAFKKDRAEFQDLMYQTLNYTASATSKDTQNPTGIDVGCGVVISGIQKDHLQGNCVTTGNELDVGIQGKGFFKIITPSGEPAYTRNGAFKISSDGALVNAQGFKVDPEISVPSGITKISITADGIVKGVKSDGTEESLGEIKLASFTNVAGLAPIGDSLYKSTVASGDAIDGTPGTDGVGTLRQGMLESSNVQLVTEMVNLITAQRGYEANSKAITTTDTMLQTVNQLKR